jgi:hypothetical protein
MDNDGIDSKWGFISLNTHFWDGTKLCMSSANATNFGLPKTRYVVPAPTISSGHKIFGFPKENYNASNWGLVIEVQN